MDWVPASNWSALVHSWTSWFNLEGIQFDTGWEVDVIGNSSLRILQFQAGASRQTYPFISFKVSLANNLSIPQVIMPWSIYQYFLLTTTTDVFLHGCIAEVGHSHSLCIGASIQVKHLGCFGVLFFNHIQLMGLFYTFATGVDNIHNCNLYIKKYYIFYLFSQSAHKLHRSQHWGVDVWALCLYILDRMDKSQTLDLCAG